MPRDTDTPLLIHQSVPEQIAEAERRVSKDITEVRLSLGKVEGDLKHHLEGCDTQLHAEQHAWVKDYMAREKTKQNRLGTVATAIIAGVALSLITALGAAAWWTIDPWAHQTPPQESHAKKP